MQLLIISMCVYKDDSELTITLLGRLCYRILSQSYTRSIIGKEKLHSKPVYGVMVMIDMMRLAMWMKTTLLSFQQVGQMQKGWAEH